LNTPLVVSLWYGSTQIASVTANGSRSDVGVALGDNGLHGFTLQIPAAYQNGAANNYQIHYETSTVQVPGSPVTLTCGSSGSSPAYAGHVDVANCSGIAGWIADTNRLNTGLVVSLWYGSTQIASATANISRPDVGAALGDNGVHGFALQIPAAYQNGTANSYQVHYETSTVQVPGSPVTLTCGSSGSTPNYTGHVDVANCSGIAGWIADTNRPNTPLVVSLWYGSTQIVSVTANISRPDVGAAIGDNGVHGFTLQIPAAYQNGAASNYQIHYETSSVQVPGSPVTLTCGSSGSTPNYTGHVDVANCSGIAGWIADTNRLNTPLVVSLWYGSAQIASVTANISRPDVGAAIGDNGVHGFTLPIPSAYLNGVANSYQIHFETSTVQVSGSPVMLTCGTSG